MNDMSIGTVLVAISTFIAGGGGVFILNWFRQKREQNRADKKQDNEIRISDTEKAFNIYKEIFASLKKDIEGVNKGYQELDKQYLECREQRAILQGKLDLANATIANLQSDKQQLLKQIEELKKGLDKTKQGD